MHTTCTSCMQLIFCRKNEAPERLTSMPVEGWPACSHRFLKSKCSSPTGSFQLNLILKPNSPWRLPDLCSPVMWLAAAYWPLSVLKPNSRLQLHLSQVMQLAADSSGGVFTAACMIVLRLACLAHGGRLHRSVPRAIDVFAKE